MTLTLDDVRKFKAYCIQQIDDTQGLIPALEMLGLAHESMVKLYKAQIVAYRVVARGLERDEQSLRRTNAD